MNFKSGVYTAGYQGICGQLSTCVVAGLTGAIQLLNTLKPNSPRRHGEHASPLTKKIKREVQCSRKSKARFTTETRRTRRRARSECFRLRRVRQNPKSNYFSRLHKAPVKLKGVNMRSMDDFRESVSFDSLKKTTRPCPGPGLPPCPPCLRGDNSF
jgi:hypothetical protein